MMKDKLSDPFLSKSGLACTSHLYPTLHCLSWTKLITPFFLNPFARFLLSTYPLLRNSQLQCPNLLTRPSAPTCTCIGSTIFSYSFMFFSSILLTLLLSFYIFMFFFYYLVQYLIVFYIFYFLMLCPFFLSLITPKRAGFLFDKPTVGWILRLMFVFVQMLWNVSSQHNFCSAVVSLLSQFGM